MNKGIKHDILKRMNLCTILDSISEKQPVSRKDLAAHTCLTPGAVSRLVSELINCGLVVESGHDKSEKRLGGPNPILLCISGGPPYVIAVNLGVAVAMVGLVNFHADIIEQESFHFNDSWDSKKIISSIIECVELIIKRSRLSLQKDVLALGVGVAGTVDTKEGILLWHKLKTLRYYPLKETLENLLGVPTYVDNFLQSMALAEARFGKGKNLESFAYVYVGNVVCSAMVLEGKVLNGKRNLIGQIGHNVVNPEGAQCICGNRGCLEAIISDQSIVNQAKQLYNSNFDTKLRILAGTPDKINKDLVIKAAEDGDELCGKLLKQRGSYVGEAIANIVNLFDPQMVIIARSVGNYESTIEFEAISQAYKKNVCFENTCPPIVRSENKTGELFYIGAASLAIRMVLSPEYTFPF